MILEAKVVEIIDTYKARVRIPLIHKSEKDGATDSELPVASIVTLPGVQPGIRAGDTVMLGFLRNNIHDPVILGSMYMKSDSKASPHTSGATVSTFNTTNSTVLCSDTTIGEVTYKQLEQLIGVKENIQFQLESIDKRLTQLDLHAQDSDIHAHEGVLQNISKLVLDSGMYGDTKALSRLKPADGQVFFLLEE